MKFKIEKLESVVAPSRASWVSKGAKIVKREWKDFAHGFWDGMNF